MNIKITGKDLKKLGIPPSKKYSDFFEYLTKLKLNNPKINELEETKIFFKH